MRWNWQLSEWPNFSWDPEKLVRAEKLFTEEAGVIAGAARYINESARQALFVDLMSLDALSTSAIEGEFLDRQSVHSSIQKALGLKVHARISMPAEQGIAEMMVNLYQTISKRLTEKTLFDWHQMIINDSRNLGGTRCYRTHTESMQIVSGPYYARKIHFEAPPSSKVASEMTMFLTWFEKTVPDQKAALPALARAGIAHLWFESIHPFEDGNGRVGRAIAEKVLGQGSTHSNITVLAQTLLKRRKEYYQALGSASKTMDITDWLLWFATVVIEAQRNTLAYIDFIIHKTQLLDSVRDVLNVRQEKALLRLFKAGPEGFIGGLSASNYMKITKATSATTTRDLNDLVKKKVLYRVGKLKATRYFLNMKIKPIKKVTLREIQ